jgi:hypothetical protein
MIRAVLAALQLWVAPLLAGVFTLWAALVALAELDDAGIPRLLTPSHVASREALTSARSLHVARLVLLAIAAALAGIALVWWAWPLSEAVSRFLVAVLMVWILGDLAPRLWAANEPGLVRFDGKVVQHTLLVLRPMLTAVAWMDRGFQPRRAGIRPK